MLHIKTKQKQGSHLDVDYVPVPTACSERFTEDKKAPQGGGSFQVEWNAHLRSPLPRPVPLLKGTGIMIRNRWNLDLPFSIATHSTLGISPWVGASVSSSLNLEGGTIFPKKSNASEWSNYLIIVLISCASKVMLQILQVSLQQYLNQEIPEVQAGFRKRKGTRHQIANIHWIIEKAREFQKIYFCFIDYTKAFDCVDHNKQWKIFKERGIPDHLTCFLRNLYAGQEARVRTKHVRMDWFKVRKGIPQGCVSSPCLFNFDIEYILQNAALDESQTGIKIARRNVNNLRYADNTTTLMAESEEELKKHLD